MARNRLQSMSTLSTELGGGRNRALAVGTVSRQRRSTFLAELGVDVVLVMALRAFHRGPRVTFRVVDASACDRSRLPKASERAAQMSTCPALCFLSHAAQ